LPTTIPNDSNGCSLLPERLRGAFRYSAMAGGFQLNIPQPRTGLFQSDLSHDFWHRSVHPILNRRLAQRITLTFSAA
jgi:hypothetical protein